MLSMSKEINHRNCSYDAWECTLYNTDFLLSVKLGNSLYSYVVDYENVPSPTIFFGKLYWWFDKYKKNMCNIVRIFSLKSGKCAVIG
jgi:hypothetical protein